MAYSFNRAIAIDHAKVAADLVNFPVLIADTYDYLRTVANGGQVTSASGFDIVFTSDAAGTVPLAHEIDSYDATTGKVAFWVKVPAVSHSVDSLIWMWYGNAAVTTSQENKAALWTSSAGVWHFSPYTTGVVSGSDSSANANTVNNHSGGTGIIGNAQQLGLGEFSGLINPVGLPTGTNPRTLELWFKAPAGQAAVAQCFAGWGAVASYQAFQMLYDGGGNLSLDAYNTSTSFPWAYDANWHHLVAALPSGATALGQAHLYLDGVGKAGTPSTPIINTGSSKLEFAHAVGQNLFMFQGLLDEVRIWPSELPASWINTEYVNQSDPPHFYTIGPAGGNVPDLKQPQVMVLP